MLYIQYVTCSVYWHRSNRAWSVAIFADKKVVGLLGYVLSACLSLGLALFCCLRSDVSTTVTHVTRFWHGHKDIFHDCQGFCFFLLEKREIWPSRVNRASGSETGSVVSITHHTHGSSWETAGLTGPFDTQIWKGLTNYWGKGWGAWGGYETVWSCQRAIFFFFF